MDDAERTYTQGDSTEMALIREWSLMSTIVSFFVCSKSGCANETVATNFVLIVTKQARSVVIVTVFVKNVIYCSICFFFFNEVLSVRM